MAMNNSSASSWGLPSTSPWNDAHRIPSKRCALVPWCPDLAVSFAAGECFQWPVAKQCRFIQKKTWQDWDLLQKEWTPSYRFSDSSDSKISEYCGMALRSSPVKNPWLIYNISLTIKNFSIFSTLRMLWTMTTPKVAPYDAAHCDSKSWQGSGSVGKIWENHRKTTGKP